MSQLPRLPLFGFTLCLFFAKGNESLQSNDLGFAEKFALAEDRAAAITELVPGTPDFYFYSALLAQQEKRFDEVAGILENWEKRHGKTPQLQQIRHRQALLTYRESPDDTLTYLKKQLGLRFDHQKQELRKTPNFPSALDSKQITWESYFGRNASPQNLSHVSDAGIDRVIRKEVVLTPAQRRSIFSRIAYPDYDRLVGLIAADLRSKESRGFGEFPIHEKLTEPQLIELLGLRPSLLQDGKYVAARLVRMKPAVGSVKALTLEEEEQYLADLWAFVDTLAPSFNSLKASVRYRQLENAQKRGEHPEDLFLSYLRLPRQLPYVEPRYLRDQPRESVVADLNADFSGQTGFGAIRVDEPVVRSYLETLLREAESYDRYAPLIRESYLKQVFAETKLLYGVGEAERWYAMLSPSRVEELQKRVEISLLPSNPSRVSPADEVTLQVELKNVSELLVKLYHVNEFNYYRDQKREINTDLKLDGLIANEEFSLRFSKPPLQREVEAIALEGLAGKRGVWVVELIGNGISSRALIRKGRLRYVSQPTAGGELFRVLTEANEPAEDPTIWFGGKSYTPEENGLILLPFSNAGTASFILSGSGMSSLAKADLPQENYLFDSGVLLSQESLLPGAKASIAIRPRLTLAGEGVDVNLIEKPKITVRMIDQDGIESISEREDFALSNTEESIHQFLVPDRLRKVKVELTGEIPYISKATGEQKIQVTKSFDVNGIDTQPVTRDLFLSRTTDGYQLEVRGRTGELLADRSVRVAVHHGDFSRPYSVNLKSDGQGCVELGALRGIVKIDGFLEGANQRSWDIEEQGRTLPRLIQATSDETVEIPVAELSQEVSREDVAIFQLRGGGFTKDLFPVIEKKEGRIELASLDPGDYLVHLRGENHSIQLRVTEAENGSLGYALGKKRLLETGYAKPLIFRGIQADNEKVSITLGNVGKGARLHLLATRFLPEFSPFDELKTPLRDGLFSVSRGFPESFYVSGRDIGEEYRYILDRRNSKAYPGNMLPRPGLILNPWALQETETDRDEAEEGEVYKRSAPMSDDARRKAGAGASDKSKREGERAVTTPSVTFLGSQPVLLTNLQIGEDGVVEINRELLRDRQHLHFVAVEGEQVSYESLSIDPPLNNLPIRNLSLKESLDTEKSFTQQRNVTLLLPKEKLEIEDFRSAQIESYSTVSELFATLLAIRPDDTFSSFQFLANWDDLEASTQQSLYSEFACHELHFFLSRKDPEFFKQVVEPYLKNKKDKTFLDHYLLEENLEGYLRPWEHSRLNVVEKILLARRLGGGELGRTSRHVTNRVELLPPNPAVEALYFRKALLGRRADSSSMADRFSGAMDGLVRGGFGGGGGAAADPFAEAPSDYNSAARRGVVTRIAKSAQAPTAAPAMVAEAASADNFADADSEALVALDLRQLREQGKDQMLFERLESTKEWAENNYYHLPIEQQNESLIKENAFWQDFAEWDNRGGFYSREFPVATNSFAEMMFTLSVLDLPFDSEDPEIEVEDNLLTFVAGSPSVVFHEEIRESTRAEEATPVLVSQNYYRFDDRYIQEQGQQRDKFVTEEFLTGVVYGSQVVLTNPSSSPHLLELLVQIPEGAVPVNGTDYTKSYPVSLSPFSTEVHDVAFYFPKTSGKTKFTIYPVQVAKDEKVIASGDSFAFRVVDTLSEVDEASWEYLSQEGSDEQVLAYLERENLLRIDLGRIAWRMREDKEFFEKATRTISERRAFHQVLWSYGIYHNSLSEAREYLQHQEGFLRQCGEWLECDLVSIDPVERRWYQQLEYSPVVNARSHQLGRVRSILNDQFFSQYQSFMGVLKYRDQLRPEDRLAVTAYLLLQDRVEEALEWQASVDRENLVSHLQYDYLAAYTALYREELDQAKAVAAVYEEFPVDKWRTRFGNVLKQISDIEGMEKNGEDDESREDRLDQLSALDAGLDLSLEGRKVTLAYNGVKEARLHYYEMDLEFLYSSEPFVSGGSGQFSYVEPNQMQVIDLPEGGKSIDIALPEKYESKNILLEVIADGERKSLPIYSNQLRVSLSDRYGRLEVRHSEEDKPLSKTYVKVYSRMMDGSVRFFKDGYTDLRGKFDYVSLSTNELEGVERFSLLIMNQDHGALVQEVDPPQQ